MYIRKFIEAVMLYTGAEEIDVIAHSMGVALSRRVLKGGWSFVSDLPFYIGQPLTNKVRTYIAIAGPNFGVQYCIEDSYYSSLRGCNKFNGFYPGSKAGDPWPTDMS